MSTCSDIRFEVPTALLFWNLMPCSSVQVHRRFREKCCLDLQGQRVTQERHQQEADDPRAENQSLADLILGLRPDTEDGGRTFSRTSVGVYQTARRYISKASILHFRTSMYNSEPWPENTVAVKKNKRRFLLIYTA